MKILVPLIFFAAMVASAFSPAEGFREIPQHLQIGPSSGSGFLFRSTNSLFLVTAKHVLFDMKQSFPYPLHGSNLLVTGWGAGATVSNAIQVNLSMLLSSRDVRGHPTRDIALVRLSYFTNGALAPVF